MRWRKAFTPVSMRRVALVSPTDSTRTVLVEAADVMAVQFDTAEGAGVSSAADVALPATALLRRHRGEPRQPRLSARQPNLEWCWTHDRLDLVAGEATLEAVLASGVRHDDVTGFVGWARADKVPYLRERVAHAGGAVLVLRRPSHLQPPTLLAPDSPGVVFNPLVRGYATPPYRDLDPSLLSGVAYVAMFGMMFADLGHGALLLASAIYLRISRSPRLDRLRSTWVLLAGAGLASMLFGVLYGEFFGPTHALAVIWLAPLDQPVPLLFAAIGIGGVLLSIAYALGIANRIREGGWRAATYAPSGIAGAGTFLGLAVVSAGIYAGNAVITFSGFGVVVASAVLVVSGFFAESGGGWAGAAQAGIVLLDLLLRICSNVVSFARLAAFGLTHAVLCQVVWQGTVGAARNGAIGVLVAILVFAVGNALAFSLEALIAGIQALRLEYYELFSRIFVTEGQPFRPWALPVDRIQAIGPTVEA
jgi:V/A-type H+-transporting ATPase subunit I